MSNTSSLLTPLEREKLVDSIRRARKYAVWDSSRGLLAYLNHVLIDAASGPVLYRTVAEPWQWALASRLIPALESIAGLQEANAYEGPRNFWFTLPRGHDKSSLIARLTNWVLAFARKPVRAITCAADLDQAGLIVEFMQKESRLNPWLADRLQFSNKKIFGLSSGARLRALSADAKSSYGLSEDLLLFDEITHWPRRDMWDAVFSGREKRNKGVLVVITNAGELNSWQHKIFKEISFDPDWYVYQAPCQLASWMSSEKIAKNRKLLPPGLAKRLFDNIWVDPSEECCFVSSLEALACESPELGPRDRGLRGIEYVGSIDYAPVRDRTALCVGHRDEDSGRILLDRMDVIQGSAEHRVPIDTVERWIVDVVTNFKPLRSLVIDPYSMESTIQRFEGTVPIERFEARGGKSNYELAANLRNLIVNNKISWYKGAGGLIVNGQLHTLTDEISEVIIRSMSYGFRLDHERNAHDDRTIALGQMALQLVRSASLITLDTNSCFF